MKRQNKWNVNGLRTRYFPKSRIGQGLISMAPWLNLVLLMFFFLMLDSKLVLKPGIAIELPVAPFKEGSRTVLIAMVLSVPGTERGMREEIVFFDDARYQITREGQMMSLKHAFRESWKEHPDSEIMIQADQKVPGGTIIDIMNQAREVGFRKVVLATRPM